jgi:hypothetical protein
MRLALGHYILNENGDPVECTDLLEWARWFETKERIVSQNTICEVPRIWVSTVFLGLDHNFSDEGPPVLFETMIFIDKSVDHCWRYATRIEALHGHAHAIDLALEQVEAGPNMDVKKTMEEALVLVEQAIDACTEWTSDQGAPNGSKAYQGKVNGWTIAVVDFDITNQGFPEGSRGYDGAGTKGLMVVHLTRELAEKAVRLAEKAAEQHPKP